MRIGLLTGNLSSGGAERTAASMANFFSNNGLDTYLITVNKCNSFYKIDEKVKNVSLDIEELTKTFSIRRAICSIKKAFTIRRKIKKMNLDCIIGMDNVMSYYTLLATAFTKTKTVGTEMSDPRYNLNTPIHTVLRKITGKFSDGYIFQTKMQKDFYPESKNPPAVIPNAIFNKYAYDIKVPDVREKTVTAMGRLHEVKMYDVLIKAFDIFHKENSDFSLHIYGEGDEKEKIEKQISELDAQEYIFIEKPTENAIEYVAKSSAYVLSSQYEGFPNALLEAMYCGVPSIATRCFSAINDLINDGENGFTVDVGDYESIAKQLDIIVNNSKISEKLSDNAIKSTRKYHIDNIGTKWINYINNLK